MNWRNKTVKNFSLIRVSVGEVALCLMRDDQQAEWCTCCQLCNLLEAGQMVHIVFKVFGELIPNKYKLFEIVLLNNLTNPIAKFAGIHGESVSNCRNLENLIDKASKSFFIVLSQLF